MQSVHYPRVFAKGRWWSADEIEGMARRWHASALEALRDHDALVVVVIAGGVEEVSVLPAASALALPIVLLPSDVRAW